jgi:hypothetical protein
LAIAMMALMIGCGGGSGGGGGDGGESGGGDLAGTWLITKEGTAAYWIFKDDGTFQKNRADEPAGGAVHFVGTYSTSGSSFSGEFTNPGVGDGEIDGTVSGDSLTMNFTEFWHSPPKVVPCTGVRQ